MNTPPVVLSLFPDLPPGGPQKPARKASKPRSKPAPAPQTVPAAAPVPGASADDFEALARRLEAQGDYRVLRRLQPRLEWPGSAERVLRVVLLDTETTGLDSAREQIIELALLRVDVDVVTGLPVGAVQVYDELEDPGKAIPKEVVALTGIRDDDVRGQRLDAARVAALLDGADLVIAHNAGFDRPFAERRFPRFAELPWACSFADLDWKAQGQGSSKLESLAQARGWFYDAHRAEMDCHALLAVLAQPLAQGTGTGLGALIQAAQNPSYALQATGAPFESKDLLKARGYRWNAEQRVWGTRLASEEALQAECDWLREAVYGGRRAQVLLERLDARVRFSGRPGETRQQAL